MDLPKSEQLVITFKKICPHYQGYSWNGSLSADTQQKGILGKHVK